LAVAVDVTNHSVLVIARGQSREVVGRPGHMTLEMAESVAASAGGKLVALRLNRGMSKDGGVRLISVQQGTGR
jgi:hypothetical protein